MTCCHWIPLQTDEQRREEGNDGTSAVRMRGFALFKPASISSWDYHPSTCFTNVSCSFVQFFAKRIMKFFRSLLITVASHIVLLRKSLHAIDKGFDHFLLLFLVGGRQEVIFLWSAPDTLERSYRQFAPFFLLFGEGTLNSCNKIIRNSFLTNIAVIQLK